MKVETCILCMSLSGWIIESKITLNYRIKTAHRACTRQFQYKPFRQYRDAGISIGTTLIFVHLWIPLYCDELCFFFFKIGPFVNSFFCSITFTEILSSSLCSPLPCPFLLLPPLHPLLCCFFYPLLYLLTPDIPPSAMFAFVLPSCDMSPAALSCPLPSFPV